MLGVSAGLPGAGNPDLIAVSFLGAQGCLVQWNPIQSTFDCPCHGSYFDKYGRVVQGPAKADLDRVELKTLIHKSVA